MANIPNRVFSACLHHRATLKDSYGATEEITNSLQEFLILNFNIKKEF